MVSTSIGRITVAVVPPRSLWSRVTEMPWRRASRLTTSRPIRRAVSGVTSPPACRSAFIPASASAGMPRPASLIEMIMPPGEAVVVTSTGAVGGE